jgi:uncharacterized protein
MSDAAGWQGAHGGLIRGPAAYVPRTPWTPGRALVATLAIIALAIGVVGALLAAGIVADAVGVPAPSRWRPSGESAAALVMMGIWQALVVVFTLLASALFGGRVLDVLALRAPAAGPRVYIGALLVLACLQVALAAIQHGLIGHDMLQDLRPFVGLIAGPNWLLALAVIGIGAAASEELLFRGFLLSALAGTRLGFWGAAVLSSALWTGLHAGYSAIGIAEVFVIGLFFSWLLWRTGSLRVPVVCHALYNSLIVLALRFVPLPA